MAQRDGRSAASGVLPLEHGEYPLCRRLPVRRRALRGVRRGAPPVLLLLRELPARVGLAGLIIGIGFFLLQRLIASGTIVFNLNPVLLAWLPTVLLAVVSVGLLARAR